MRLHTPRVDPRVRNTMDGRLPPRAQLEEALVPCPHGHKHVVCISYGAYKWERVGTVFVTVRSILYILQNLSDV